MPIRQTIALTGGIPLNPGENSSQAEWNVEDGNFPPRGIRLNDGFFTVPESVDPERTVKIGGISSRFLLSGPGDTILTIAGSLAIWRDPDTNEFIGPSQDFEVLLTSPATDLTATSELSYLRNNRFGLSDAFGTGQQLSQSQYSLTGDLRMFAPAVARAGGTDNAEVILTFSSESGVQIGGLGDFDIEIDQQRAQKLYVGQREVIRVYVGTREVTGPGGSVPAVPGNFGVNPDNARVDIEWNESVKGLQPITYRVRYRTGSNAWLERATLSTNMMIGGLTNGTTYEFQIRAENELGNSDWSPSVTARPVAFPDMWVQYNRNINDAVGLVFRNLRWWTTAEDNRSVARDRAIALESDGDVDDNLIFQVSHTGDIYIDGPTMWIARGDNTLIAYTIQTISTAAARDTTKDISLGTTINNTQGVCGDGTTVWVCSSTHDTIYAFTQATGARDSAKDITVADAAVNPGGAMFTDGTTLWSTSFTSRAISAYNVATGKRDTSKEFAIAAPNSQINGFWTDGSAAWVLDDLDYRIYPYRLSDGKPLFETDE